MTILCRPFDTGILQCPTTTNLKWNDIHSASSVAEEKSLSLLRA